MALLTPPLGAHIAAVMSGRRTLLHPVLSPVERLLYRGLRLDPAREQAWKPYARSLMRDRLNPGGVIATNVIGAITGGSSQITRALWKTYGAVFPTVKLHPVYEGAADRRPDDPDDVLAARQARARGAPSRETECVAAG